MNSDLEALRQPLQSLWTSRFRPAHPVAEPGKRIGRPVIGLDGRPTDSYGLARSEETGLRLKEIPPPAPGGSPGRKAVSRLEP